MTTNCLKTEVEPIPEMSCSSQHNIHISFIYAIFNKHKTVSYKICTYVFELVPYQMSLAQLQ
jgi:hypothetical protein